MTHIESTWDLVALKSECVVILTKLVEKKAIERRDKQRRSKKNSGRKNVVEYGRV